MSDPRPLRAGTVTTATLIVVGVAGVLAIALRRDFDAVAVAAAGLGINAALCLMPLGTIDRAMPVPPMFAVLMVLTAAAIGLFALTLTTWHLVGASSLGVAVLASCASWVLLSAMRRSPAWHASSNTDIGYWADVKRTQR